MKLFDSNTWLGSWPFALLPNRGAKAHALALRELQITRALVSPMAAVFAPEPGPANRWLLRQTRAVAELVPLPVINPALANWAEELAQAQADPRVRAVRWLPAYHNYRLSGPQVQECARAIRASGLGLVITVRLVDERHEYFALKIRGLTNDQLEPFLRRQPDLPILLTGLYRPDLAKLLPNHPQVLADLAFAEWDQTLERLVGEVSFKQLVFGSHTPFLITAAGVAKVTSARLPKAVLSAVAEGNLARFLR